MVSLTCQSVVLQAAHEQPELCVATTESRFSGAAAVSGRWRVCLQIVSEQGPGTEGKRCESRAH